MNKFEQKVFYILTLILTAFVVTIIFIFNIQNYSRENENIEKNLSKMSQPLKENMRNNKELENKREYELLDDKLDRKIFMDSNIYTIIYDSNNSILEIITHSENDLIDNEIKDYAMEILNNNKTNTYKIGNLYFDNYSYAFKNNNQLVIIDNSIAKSRLRSGLINSIILIIVLEVIVLIIANKLTKWITKPANEALEKQKQFIQDASHELKTPIAVILASSEALEDDYQEKWINNIKSESERMNTLIMNLLDLSKLENIDDEKLYVTCNVSKITQNSCLTFESLSFEKNINFQSNIEDNITLKCDPNQIKQLISIIVDNAIKHSEKEGEIIVNLKNQKNDIILEIINKGKPIPEDMREKIFERFTRVDESRNRADNRYGLGLAIAKRIVENHNGKISANSKDGYTTFKINLKKYK